jgi:hypothetical protein
MKGILGNFRKFFSLNRWRRRSGAQDVLTLFGDRSIVQMKLFTLDSGAPVPTRGSHNAILKQIEALTKEFSGQSELILYHASLIVLIRRESNLKVNFDKFHTLWLQEEEWLLRRLNIRWLVSAADTFADHSSDPVDRAMALSASVLVNTVKAYESEHYLCGSGEVVYLPERLAYVQTNLVPLFEGISCYTVGSDDTLRNMVWRIKAQGQDSLSYKIFFEIFKRLSVQKTAFGRMKAAHKRDKTKWW